ncbi:MAG: FAD-dependent thymidylate synthase [Acutalibacteraceae bacterium]|nr:FAD-dependent thymidylate synthase [Acutalibacteraceae bacterium]
MSVTVKLIAHTPNPEQVVAAAAKLCYSPSKIDNILEGLDEEKSRSFVEMLASIGHESPMEHVSFTFGIDGISRACSHQLVRHRIASYSQQSQRYVDGNKFDFVTPPSIANCPEALEEYNKAIQAQSKAYSIVRDTLVYNSIKESDDGKSLTGTQQEVIEQYKEINKAQCNAFVKKANEDARFILPNACTTSIVVTMNVRSLHNFFDHRCCNRAQWEIREVAVEMLKLCKEVAPSLFTNAGPRCLRGACPEGKMTCGKAKEVKAFFAELNGNINK